MGIAVTVGAFLRLETSVTTFSYDALIGWSEAMGLATVMVAYRVRGTLTPTLRPAMNWLIVSFLIMMAAGLQQLWLQHFTTEDWWFRYQGWLYWALLGASMTFLKTGLVLRKLTQGLAVTANPLDVVMYAAGLVSRPQDVDGVLDRLRRLTATLTPGAELTREQRQELLAIYLDLEQYLVTDERLRKLSVTSLRVSLPDSFVVQLPAAA